MTFNIVLTYKEIRCKFYSVIFGFHEKKLVAVSLSYVFLGSFVLILLGAVFDTINCEGGVLTMEYRVRIFKAAVLKVKVSSKCKKLQGT
jgi:hypothetical protein